MNELYEHAHELLNLSQAAFDSGQHVLAIVIIQELITTIMDIVNAIAANAASVMM